MIGSASASTALACCRAQPAATGGGAGRRREHDADSLVAGGVGHPRSRDGAHHSDGPRAWREGSELRQLHRQGACQRRRRGGAALPEWACGPRRGRDGASRQGLAAIEAGPQDEILADLEKGRAAEWALADRLPWPIFFETVRVHTIVGFLADPSYGGNRDYAGWRVAGYPGPRHRRGGFTPEQLEGKAPIVPIGER